MKLFVMNEEMKNLYKQAFVLCENPETQAEDLNRFLCEHTGLEDARSILKKLEYGMQTYKDMLEHNGSLSKYLDDQNISAYERRMKKALLMIQLQADADHHSGENRPWDPPSKYKLMKGLSRLDEDLLDSLLNTLHHNAAKQAEELSTLFAGNPSLQDSRMTDLPYNSQAMAMVLCIAQENGYALTEDGQILSPRMIGAHAACNSALLLVQREHVISEQTRTFIKNAVVVLAGVLIAVALVEAGGFLAASAETVLAQTTEQIALSSLKNWSYTGGLLIAILPFGGKIETWLRSSVDKLLDRIEEGILNPQEILEPEIVREQIDSVWRSVRLNEPVLAPITQQSPIEIVEV